MGSIILWIIRKYLDKKWRIPYLVYPIFIILTVNINYNINIVIYSLLVLFIACVRGWQVKTR